MRLRGKNIPLILFTDLALFFYFYLLNRVLNPFKIFSENDTTGSLFERGLPGDTLYPFALVGPTGLPFFAIHYSCILFLIMPIIKNNKSAWTATIKGPRSCLKNTPSSCFSGSTHRGIAFLLLQPKYFSSISTSPISCWAPPLSLL